MKSSTHHDLVRTAILLILTLLPSAMMAAEEKWYKVELIVFEHLGQGTLSTEMWPDNPHPLDLSQTLPLIPLFDASGAQQDQLTALIPIPFQELADIQRDLRGVVSQLELSRRYRPLIHSGWIQPPLPQTLSQAIRIVADQVPPTPLAPAGGEERAPLPTAPLEVDGSLRLSIARYIHLELDLLFNEVIEAVAVENREVTGVVTEESGEHQTAAVEILRQFRISEKRRIRSKELHYFDHPRFGAVVQVTPIQVMVPSEKEAETAAILIPRVIR